MKETDHQRKVEVSVVSGHLRKNVVLRDCDCLSTTEGGSVNSRNPNVTLVPY